MRRLPEHFPGAEMNFPTPSLRSRLLVFSASILVFGCAQLPPGGDGITTIDGAEAVIAMQKELEKPSLSLDRVIVIRMTMDGQRVEVASVAPTTIVAQPAAGNRSIFTLNPARDTLILFTRDGRRIKGYRTEIPMSEIQPGKTFRFPVAQDPGEVVDKAFTVDKVIVQ